MTQGAGRRLATARLVVIALAIATLAIVATRVGPGDTDELRAVVEGSWWGPLVFVAIAVALVVLAVPGTVPTVAAGVLYGPVAGSALAVVSVSIGATVAFAISRRLGRPAVAVLLGARGHAVDDRVAASGWRGLLVLRLIPLVPFNALNYAAGLTSLTARAYVVGTVLGILPATIALTVLGSSAHDPTSPAFIAAVVAMVVLVAVSTVVGRRSRRNEADRVEASSD